MLLISLEWRLLMSLKKKKKKIFHQLGTKLYFFLSSGTDRLSHIWEASRPTVFFFFFFPGHMSNDRVIYFLQKIQQSIIRQSGILSLFFSCWEGAKHDHMHGSLSGKSSTTPMARSIWTWLQCELFVDDMCTCYHRLFMAAEAPLVRICAFYLLACDGATKDGRK